ncbi:MAG: helix-turn-helix domain-containing protein [Nocardioides sp.]
MTALIDEFGTETEDEPDDSVEVRRRPALAAVVGLAATGLAIAYLVRAVAAGEWADWLVCGFMSGVGAAYLAVLVDSRAPLLVADEHGVRLRKGRTWRGIAWPEVERLEHVPRRSLLRDGRLVVTGTHEGELSVPLSMSTLLFGVDADHLTEALSALAGDSIEVLEAPPEVEASAEDPAAEAAPVRASTTPSPLRHIVSAVRAEIRRDAEDEERPVVTPQAPPETLPGDAEPVEMTIVIGELVAAPTVVDPVIGPVLTAARTRIGLSVDQLAERTRIRPHVIESIEVDDFAPCGGDFYARGHLRTLARVLGSDVAPLLASYDERYADAPIDPRRVFEAELATGSGGSIRGTRGGLNWSVLIAAVMTVVLVWSVARLIMDNPAAITPPGPRLNNSGGLKPGATNDAPKVPVVLTAAGGGAKVVVRNAASEVVFNGQLAFGQSTTLQVQPPVRVSSTDGSLEVAIDGDDRGALGETGQEAQNSFVVDLETDR